MASTTDFGLRQDLIDAASQEGMHFLGDDDGNSSLATSESNAVLDYAVREATATIEGAIAPWVVVPLVQDDARLNAWLRQCWIALGRQAMASRMGREVPRSWQESAVEWKQRLELVRMGRYRVPQLTYPMDRDTELKRLRGKPIVLNPKKRKGSG